MCFVRIGVLDPRRGRVRVSRFARTLRQNQALMRTEDGRAGTGLSRSDQLNHLIVGAHDQERRGPHADEAAPSRTIGQFEVQRKAHRPKGTPEEKVRRKFGRLLFDKSGEHSLTVFVSHHTAWLVRLLRFVAGWIDLLVCCHMTARLEGVHLNVASLQGATETGRREPCFGLSGSLPIRDP